MRMRESLSIVRNLLVGVLLTAYCLRLTAFAGELPSVFRGVVIADSPAGVRVVEVDPSSQAAQADLRAEDIIARVQGRDVRTIDEFAVLSHQLKGRVSSVTVICFRNGAPQELRLHLYSYPVLTRWGVTFVPDDELRFADPRIGLEYWRRLGRGFVEAGKRPEAIRAYLNALHHVPDDAQTAVTVTALFAQVSQQAMRAGRWPEAIAAMGQSLGLMEQLFDAPLTPEQLAVVKQELEATLLVLRSRVPR